LGHTKLYIKDLLEAHPTLRLNNHLLLTIHGGLFGTLAVKSRTIKLFHY